MVDWPDPNVPLAPPTKMDELVYGADCTRHPLLGCIIGHGNGAPEEQARNFLISLRNATFHKVAGRAHDLSEEEFRAKWRELEAWEAAGNFVQMRPRLDGYPTNVVRPPRPAPNRAELEQAITRAVAAAAMVERGDKPVH